MSHIRKPHARPVVVSGCANCGVGGTYYEVSDYRALSSAFDNLERQLRTLEKKNKELEENNKELVKRYDTLSISYKELETSYEYRDHCDVNDIKEDILTLRQIIKIHETATGESMNVDELLTQILDKLK